MNPRHFAALIVLFLSFPAPGLSQARIPPYDLWTDDVLAAIRNRDTLEVEIVPHLGYSDVFFTSNPSAGWYDSSPPYAAHTGGKIRIHAFMAAPPFGGPYPALVIGHGHGGHADSTLVMGVAALGYVGFYIDGPQAGQSTGGPHDDNQAWISVDSGPQYGYLYHYAYAGMRALTALEYIAALPGNPYRIDTAKFAVLGASMGGIFATQINGVDSRVKAAVAMASAGNWQHTLRYRNSWLYHGIYVGTRDLPYNGSDPLNSIEDVDTDPTTVTFIDYFDPIRYAPRQFAPILTIIGTHDQYFPLPNANLMEQAITSAGTAANFEKRLWFLPNAPHQFDTNSNLISVTAGVKQWLDSCFANGPKPLATPGVALSSGSAGLRFDISLAEPQARLSGAQVTLYAATRVDTSAATIDDFKAYTAVLQGDRFVAQIPAGEKTSAGDLITADNVLYFATATAAQLPVSSLMYKGARPIDLSTDFTPVIGQFPGDSVVAPVPPPYTDAAVTAASSLPVPSDPAYQGIALTNATDKPEIVRLEARDPEGRLAAAEGLINPVFISLPPRTQQVFLAEQWMGPGARNFNGSFQAGWSAARTDSLAFRGNVSPSELDGIGPLAATSTSLWLPLVPERDPGSQRLLRIFSSSAAPAGATVVFRNRFGNTLQSKTVTVSVAARGSADLPVSVGGTALDSASLEIHSTAPVSARLEVQGGKDPWSIDALPSPSAASYVQPHVEWNGIFTTTLLMLNTSSTGRDVRMKLHTTSGEAAALNIVKFMNPYEAADLTVESMFGITSGVARGAGWLEVEVPNSQVVVIALATDAKSGASAASALLPAGTSSWTLPFFVENPGYWTGLALANGGTAKCTVSLTAYSAAGSQLGRAEWDLEGQQSHTALMYQWISGLAAGATGYISISSTGPVAPLAYFGTADGASLAAIPFTPVSP